MSRASSSNTIAVFLTIILLAPSAFFVAPQKAEAGWPVFDIPNEISSALSVIEETLIQVNTYTSMVALYADYINTYVLQPLAFVLSGNLLKTLTASVVKFVIGQSNGTGAPQFTTNLNKSLQTLSDSQAQMYLKQISQTNSPFASSITSALNTDYLQKTSLAGFWAANMCTLQKSSPNVSAYLAGNWSQGGVAAWFALTTESQNNPYTLYQNSQTQLANVVDSAVSSRLSELSWGQGFMSWCSVSDSATQTQNAAATELAACAANGGTPAYCDKVFSNAGGAVGGINPGDACINKDGTQGTMQTPGSVIKATLDKVLGAQQDKLVQMGNISSQITKILGDIATVINTVNLASNILGGNSSMGGLLNAGGSSGALTQFAPPTRNSSGSFTSGYFGTTNSAINQSAASSAVSGGFSNDIISRTDAYLTAWHTIGVSADATASAVTSLINVCTTNADTARAQLASAGPDTKDALQAFIDAATLQATDAQTAFTTEVLPVTTKAAGVSAEVTAILAMNNKVKNEIGTSAYADDVKTLTTMPPTSSDVSDAARNATDSYALATTQTAASDKATPPGSLTITIPPAMTIVGQMNNIIANAKVLQDTVCNPNWTPGSTTTGP